MTFLEYLEEAIGAADDGRARIKHLLSDNEGSVDEILIDSAITFLRVSEMLRNAINQALGAEHSDN